MGSDAGQHPGHVLRVRRQQVLGLPAPQGQPLGRETVLFFFFNGVGILITDGVVALVHYGLGLTDTFSYNVALILGIGLATLFRLYCYRRWVFLYADGEASVAEQLEPETSGT